MSRINLSSRQNILLTFFIQYLHFCFGTLLWLWLCKIYHQCITCCPESEILCLIVKEKMSCSRNAQQFEVCPILRQRIKLLYTCLIKSAVSVLLPAAVGNPTTSVFSQRCFVSAAPTFAGEWPFSLQYYQEKQEVQCSTSYIGFPWLYCSHDYDINGI